MDSVLKFLDKLLSMIVDRRLIFYMLITAGMLFGIPGMVDSADFVNEEIAQLVVLAGQMVEIVAGLLVLVHSWGLRAPSGLNWKDVQRKGEELLDWFRELGANV